MTATEIQQIRTYLVKLKAERIARHAHGKIVTPMLDDMIMRTERRLEDATYRDAEWADLQEAKEVSNVWWQAAGVVGIVTVMVVLALHASGVLFK